MGETNGNAIATAKAAQRRAAYAFALAAGALAAAACSRSPSSAKATTEQTTGAVSSAPATEEAPRADAAQPFVGKKFRDGRGTVKGFGEGRKSVKIAHGELSDFAKATTTSFPVMAPFVLDGLKEGDTVDFTFSEEFDKSLGGILLHKIQKR